MAKQTYTVGQVLTAAQMGTLQTNDYNQTVSAKTASYVLVAADAGTRITMSNAGATTITVNTSLFSAGDTLELTNIGAGVCTVTAGTATVSTSATLALAQYDSGTLYFTSAGVAIFFASDAADGMANPLTTTGDIIYSSSGTTAARLGIGSAGQVLNVSSGIPAWATASAGAVTLIQSGTFSAVTSKSINSAFTSTYLNYYVSFNSAPDSAVSGAITMRYRASGSDLSTGNYYGGWYGYSSAGTGGGVFNNGATSANIGFQQSTTAARGGANMNLYFNQTQDNGYGLATQYNFTHQNTNGFAYGGFSYLTGTVYDGFTVIFTVASSGSYKIYGMGS